MLVKYPWEVEGIPWPIQTLGCKLPNFHNEKIFKESKFEWNYPSGKFITLDDVGVTLDEALDGIFYDIEHDTAVSSIEVKDHIISTGVGKETRFHS